MFFFLFTALERKISVRANRDELVQKGILLPESPITPVPEASKYYTINIEKKYYASMFYLT